MPVGASGSTSTWPTSTPVADPEGEQPATEGVVSDTAGDPRRGAHARRHYRGVRSIAAEAQRDAAVGGRLEPELGEALAHHP